MSTLELRRLDNRVHHRDDVTAVTPCETIALKGLRLRTPFERVSHDKVSRVTQ
jgi:hypothetical protein